MNKKLALSVLALLALAASVVAAKKHMDYLHEGSPYLVGHCFIDPKQGAVLAIVESKKVQDDSGNEVDVYATEIVLGPFSLNGPLIKVRESNKSLAEDAAAGVLQEVNCENGEPFNK